MRIQQKRKRRARTTTRMKDTNKRKSKRFCSERRHTKERNLGVGAITKKMGPRTSSPRKSQK